jgi:hypothetical protein
MLVTLVKMIYAVNSKIISMATAAILKFLSLKTIYTHARMLSTMSRCADYFRNFQNGHRCHGNGQNAKEKLKHKNDHQ